MSDAKSQLSDKSGVSVVGMVLAKIPSKNDATPGLISSVDEFVVCDTFKDDGNDVDADTCR